MSLQHHRRYAVRGPSATNMALRTDGRSHVSDILHVQGGGSSRSGSRSPTRSKSGSVSDRDASGSDLSASSDDDSRRAAPKRPAAMASPFSLRLPDPGGGGGAAEVPAVPKLGVQEIDSAARHTTQEQVHYIGCGYPLNSAIGL